MTRSEFLNNVTDWCELIIFCNEEGCNICEDVSSEEERDEIINDILVDWAQSYRWDRLAEKLDDIPIGYDYYRTDDYGDFVGLTDEDFDCYKDDVLDWMDERDCWEEEEEEGEEYCEPPTDPEDEIPVEEEAIPLEELFATCSGQLNTIRANENEREEEEASELEAFVCKTVDVEGSSI